MRVATAGGSCAARVAPLLVVVSLLAVAGCTTRTSIPEPAPVVEAYARAVEQQDAAALYSMMSSESRRAVSERELSRVLGEQREELRAHVAGVRSATRVLAARAQVRYADGEVVSLDLADDGFRVTAADALPASARSPEQALGQLRRVLARRSYSGLVRVLSPRTRAALERDLRSLVQGLREPDALRVDVVGDSATVELSGGHRVTLRREDGVWYVDDFN